MADRDLISFRDHLFDSIIRDLSFLKSANQISQLSYDVITRELQLQRNMNGNGTQHTSVNSTLTVPSTTEIQSGPPLPARSRNVSNSITETAPPTLPGRKSSISGESTNAPPVPSRTSSSQPPPYSTNTGIAPVASVPTSAPPALPNRNTSNSQESSPLGRRKPVAPPSSNPISYATSNMSYPGSNNFENITKTSQTMTYQIQQQQQVMPPVENSSSIHPDLELPQMVAIADFTTGVEGDLEFKKGSIIKVLEEVNDEWFRGTTGGREGIFPKTFVQPRYTLTKIYFFSSLILS